MHWNGSHILLLMKIFLKLLMCFFFSTLLWCTVKSTCLKTKKHWWRDKHPYMKPIRVEEKCIRWKAQILPCFLCYSISHKKSQRAYLFLSSSAEYQIHYGKLFMRNAISWLLVCWQLELSGLSWCISEDSQNLMTFLCNWCGIDSLKESTESGFQPPQHISFFYHLCWVPPPTYP